MLAALAEANGGHQIAYGEDVYTERLTQVMRGHFGEQTEVFPVFNGTGANVTALTSLLPRWGAVVAASTAHINTDENGAPERISGIKLLTVDTPDGKLTPELIDRQAWAGATSTGRSRWPSASPRPPSWARCTRSRRSGRSPTTLTPRA